jgi:ribosomal protein L37E
MSDDNWNDDEDWYDQDDDLDDEEAARCPECGAGMYIVTDKCPSCGYWLTEADRRVMWSGISQPRAVKIVAVMVLVIFLAVLLLGAISVF